MGFDLGHFVSNAVHSAGKAVGGAARGIGDETGKIGKGLKKVPFVGPLLHGVWGAMGSPFDLTYRIAKGERLDHALIDHFKSDIADVKEVAPYVKMVISFVPGVGTAVSAAIGAATAIISGQPISDVIMQAVKGAIPGGDIAASAFDAASAIIQKKGLGAAALAALPIPEEAKAPLEGALKVVESIASGKKPGQALIDATMTALPPDVQSTVKTLGGDKLAGGLADAAFKQAVKKGMSPEQAKAAQVGIAMAHAQRLQQVTVTASRSPQTLAQLAQDGQTVEAHTPSAAAAKKLLKHRGENGFDIGLGLMQYSGMTEAAFLATRTALSAPDQKGFDLAVSHHIGRVANPPPPGASPEHEAGFYISKGMQGAHPDLKASLMTLVTADDQAKAGAATAVQQIASARGGTLEVPA
jgi:hypothetical protein